MSTLDEEYELTDEDREVIASDVKDMNNENFESYSKKLSVLLKGKSRELLARKDTEEKLKAEKAEKAETKASAEEVEDSTVIETAVEDAQEEELEDIPNSTTAEEESLQHKYKRAFSLDQFELK